MNAYQNLYVFHKEEKLDREYAMIDSQIYCNYSFSHDDSQIRGIDFSNGKQSYCTDDKTDEHFSSIDSLFDINRRYYRTFLNPFDQTMDITLEIIAPVSTINSEDDEEQRIIVSGEIKYYEYGDTYFGDMHVQKIQNFDASSYKGKWIFNNEYE